MRGTRHDVKDPFLPWATPKCGPGNATGAIHVPSPHRPLGPGPLLVPSHLASAFSVMSSSHFGRPGLPPCTWQFEEAVELRCGLCVDMTYEDSNQQTLSRRIWVLTQLCIQLRQKEIVN